MRVSKIRNLDGTKLTENQMNQLKTEVEQAINQAGYETYVMIVAPKKKMNDPTDIRNIVREIRKQTKQGQEFKGMPLQAMQLNIGLHMKCFTINTSKHGNNARLDNHYCKTVKGYKRTNLPTWEQREHFNHIVNDIFDKLNINATIVSGPYKIREYENGRIDEWSPKGQGFYQGGYDSIMPETEAREYCNSVDKEKLHREKLNAIAREKRRLAKLEKSVS